jgi:hypothetical protein
VGTAVSVIGLGPSHRKSRPTSSETWHLSRRGNNLARQIRADTDLRNAAGHINYEISMLIHTAKHLAGWHSSPVSTAPVDNEKNEALESFLLYFRNLRAFLCPSLQGQPKPDDILASDFLREPESRDVGVAVNLATEKKRLDKMLAHLSYARDQYIAAGEDGWLAPRMASNTLTEFDRFLAILAPEMEPWFPLRSELEQQRSHLAYIASLAPEPEPKRGVTAKVSDREGKAIHAAISSGECRDPWRDPVDAVVRAVGLSSDKARELLSDLQTRNLLTLCPEARDGNQPHPAARWTLGPEHPDAPKE